MSECVARMKTPSSCYVCPLRIACVLYKKWLANEADMPCVYDDGCLIICQLPEGHGRLVDKDLLMQDLDFLNTFDTPDDGKELSYEDILVTIDDFPTIVPAERRSE